jgi:FkbM family methyltransferase
LDVGANVGQYASELRRIGYRGAIVSFEPIPECYQKLAEQGKADPGWTGYNVALADRTSQRSFNVMKSSDFSSFRQPSGISSLHFPEENLVDRVLDIETTTLNQVIPELGGSRYFLKMDTQGYDLEVFRGSDAVRDSISGLQTEVSLVHIYENVPAWHEAIQEYREAGYGLVAMHPLQHDEYKEAVEINCYFSRL